MSAIESEFIRIASLLTGKNADF